MTSSRSTAFGKTIKEATNKELSVGMEPHLERANNLPSYKGPRLRQIVGSSTKWRSAHKRQTKLKKLKQIKTLK